MIEVGDTVHLVRNSANDRYFSARGWPLDVPMTVMEIDDREGYDISRYIYFKFNDDLISRFQLGCSERRLQVMGGPW